MLNPADAVFAARLAALLPEGGVRAPEPRYLEEPRGRWTGQGGVLVLPRSTDEVQVVVRACAEARVGLVPWGGGTGLVGGQIMPDGPAPVILSLERMARVRNIWPEENALEVEAGATLAAVMMPSVPSAPISRLRRSYPVLSLRSRFSPPITDPSAITASTPRQRSRALP